jgi:hypothetical protein
MKRSGMEELMAYRENLLSALESVVSRLSKTVANLTDANQEHAELSESNTPHYILFRLREVEIHVFSQQLPRFLAEICPILPVFDEQSWMADHYHPDEPITAIMEKVAKLRHDELAWLNGLPVSSWSRLARHPWWGMHTLQWWVELQLDYSFQHLKLLTRSDGL